MVQRPPGASLPILYRLGQVVDLYGRAAFQVRYGTGQAQDAVVGAGRQVQPFQGLPEECPAGGTECAYFRQHPHTDLGIGVYLLHGLETFVCRARAFSTRRRMASELSSKGVAAVPGMRSSTSTGFTVR